MSMAVLLTASDFVSLCGLRSLHSIAGFAASVGFQVRVMCIEKDEKSFFSLLGIDPTGRAASLQLRSTTLIYIETH